jgi:YesN/AraC family two-component response regulator
MTDVVMPGESGIDLAHFIQQEDPGIHIMIVSGYIPDHENELLSHWMRLPKPFQKKQLLQMLEHIPEESVPMLHIVPKESY